MDYKATSKAGEVELTDAKYHDAYRRQMEIYQWLFRKNDFKVSDTGYFVYANGQKDRKAFDAKLEFDVKIIPYKGNDDWIENIIMKINECFIIFASIASKASIAPINEPKNVIINISNIVV